VDEAAWRSCIGKVGKEQTEGKKCFLSLDLSEKNDLTALGAVWKGADDELAARLWYWTTPAGLERRSALDRIPYKVYVEKGELSVTQSAVVDYEFVAARIKDLVSEYDVDSLTIDPSFWEKFRDACERIGLAVWVYEGPDEPEGEGLKVVRHSQGTKVAFGERNLCMPHSITRLTDKVLTGQMVIEENRLTQYCAANTVIRTDPIGNQMFDKSRQRGRMDGMIALAMATGASEGVKVKENLPSVYESRGIRTV
jgi:phage terminase large subunit-like protein